jgi:uncharacterized membrane protein YfcA
VITAAFAVGFLTGVLANGGGFLLVPLFIVALGLSAKRAVGTSMVTVGALVVPTLTVHVLLGHVDWAVACLFALGVVPGTVLGTRAAARIPVGRLRRAFGAALMAFAAAFLATRLG